MRKVLIAVLMTLFFTFCSRAFELRCDEDVSVGQEKTIDEDFIAVGDTVEIKGQIDGDFIGIGRYIRCQGVIEDDVTVIGRDIDIEGDIGDSLRAAAERIKTDAHIKGDIIAHNCIAIGGMPKDDNWEFTYGEDMPHGDAIRAEYLNTKSSTDVIKIKEAMEKEVKNNGN